MLEVNALGLLPWKFKPDKGLNVLADESRLRNAIISAFVLWAVLLDPVGDLR